MLKDESLTYEIHIFLNIIVRNILFVPLIYRITSIVKYLKWRYKIYKNNIDFDCTKSDSLVISSSDVIRYTKMGNGTKRVYSSMLQNVDCLVRNQQNNAECIKKALDGNDLVKDVFWGENAYMCIIRTSDPKKLSDWFSKREIETSTHFKPCICHDRSFGYKNKTCSKSEQLVKELLFVPTYAKGKYYKF